jgi:hypothetical protein
MERPRVEVVTKIQNVGHYSQVLVKVVRKYVIVSVTT